MARITKKDVKRQFELFVEALGGKVATSWDDVGGFDLDYNTIYGGYKVVKIHNERGAISEPFGSERFRAAAFVDQLIFATKAFEQNLLTDRPLFSTAKTGEE